MATEEQFSEFAHSVAPMLHRTAWLLTTDRHAAEDLVQDTLERMYGVMRRRRRLDNPAGYARTVLVRLHVDQRRRRSSTEVIMSELPEAGTETDRSGVLALQAALDELGRQDRAVVILRYYFGLSVAETAREIGISDGAVKMRAARALGRLRERLTDVVVPHEPDPAQGRRP